MCKKEEIPKDFISLESCAILNDVEKKEIENLIYNKSYGNDLRFKKINGKHYIHKNYKAIYQEEIQKIYTDALVISKTKGKLAKEISLTTGIKEDTLKKYFIRFNFKQISKAENILFHLKKYIKENSVFPLEDIKYAL